MKPYPEYFDRAYSMVHFLCSEQEIDAFVARWGELGGETFVRVLKEGDEEERLIAIFALGFFDEPWIPEYLLPQLHSPLVLERWASAIVFGRKKHEVALPLLATMLTEFLPFSEERVTLRPFEWNLCDFWHCTSIVSILVEWNEPSLAPVFRTALLKFWNTLDTVSQDFKASERPWCDCQDVLAYGLGRLRAVGALTGLDLPEYAIRIAFLQMGLGYIDTKFIYVYDGDRPFFNPDYVDPQLKVQLETVLEQQFGLTSEERVLVIEQRDKNFAQRVPEWTYRPEKR